MVIAVLLLSALYAREIYMRNKKAEQIDIAVQDIIADARKSFDTFQKTGDARSFERGISGLYAFYRVYPLVSKYDNNNYIILHEMIAFLATDKNYDLARNKYTDRLIEALGELEEDYNSAPGLTKLKYLTMDLD